MSTFVQVRTKDQIDAATVQSPSSAIPATSSWLHQIGLLVVDDLASLLSRVAEQMGVYRSVASVYEPAYWDPTARRGEHTNEADRPTTRAGTSTWRCGSRVAWPAHAADHGQDPAPPARRPGL